MVGKLSLVLVAIISIARVSWSQSDEELQAEQYLKEYNIMAEAQIFEKSIAEWNYNTNITDENQQAMIAADLKYAKFVKEVGVNASQFNIEDFQDETLKRAFVKLRDIGTAALNDQDKQEKLASALATMEGIYSSATVSIDGKGEMNLEPDLTRLMANSTDYNELLQAWVGWRDASGKKMRKTYEEFVSLSNEAIRENGYDDTGAWWRAGYESDTFEQDIEDLYKQIEPFYTNLHIYIRRKLKERYKEEFPKQGHIPAHLLGNMWAQDWSNLLSLVQPFDRESVDVTSAMVDQGYTAMKMFKVSESFFTSLGLLPMTEEFWNNSMIERPDDGRDVVCHASAWDFYNGKDFRIKMCTDITMNDLVTVHHEMGHIQYYMQYKDQPVPFRDGANPGFHEAIGDVLALSVITPQHLKKIGLLKNETEDEQSDLNFLLSMALEKIAFLPFGYLIDQWRWKVFSGEISPSNYNDKWWQLRCKYQGISPPVQRTENDFDPGAKYHIPANTPYIRYFVSGIIQFQFHQALCAAANQTGPLHKCDIYQSKEAGDLLGQVLRLGSSQPWQDTMELMTGQRKMDAEPLLEYFQPIMMWLTEQNAEAEDTVGWQEACPGGSSRLMTSAFLIFLILYSSVLRLIF